MALRAREILIVGLLCLSGGCSAAEKEPVEPWGYRDMCSDPERREENLCP